MKNYSQEMKKRTLFRRLLLMMVQLVSRGGELVDRSLLHCLIERGGLRVGEGTYGLRFGTVSGLTSFNPVVIGNYCSFAPGVKILANVEHQIDLPSTYPFKAMNYEMPVGFYNSNARSLNQFNPDAKTKGPICIGNDVWVGQNAIILSGVTVGTGAIIGAGAVVVHNVPPYAIVVGNPARVIRTRFQAELVERLLESKWWMLPKSSLTKFMPMFYSNDIEKFLRAVANEKTRIRE